MIIVIKNILYLVLGILIGMIVNMGLIITGNYLVPFNESMDPMNATMWEMKFFIFPFFAHAFGTFIGAYITSRFVMRY